jgi:multiple sugar transport system ATP-binding protein
VRERIGDRTLLIAGIRPEYFEDASLLEEHKRDEGAVFEVPIEVTEWLGDSQYAYIPYEAPEDIAQQLRELEQELDSEHLRTQMVVSLDPMSRLRDGETATLWLNPSRMHLFDPRSGENLTREAPAVSVPRQATAKEPA